MLSFILLPKIIVRKIRKDWVKRALLGFEEIDVVLSLSINQKNCLI